MRSFSVCAAAPTKGFRTEVFLHVFRTAQDDADGPVPVHRIQTLLVQRNLFEFGGDFSQWREVTLVFERSRDFELVEFEPGGDAFAVPGERKRDAQNHKRKRRRR